MSQCCFSYSAIIHLHTWHAVMQQSVILGCFLLLRRPRSSTGAQLHTTTGRKCLVCDIILLKRICPQDGHCNYYRLNEVIVTPYIHCDGHVGLVVSVKVPWCICVKNLYDVFELSCVYTTAAFCW